MKIIEIYKKYEEIINYLIIGVLTTIVNLAVKYALLFTVLNASDATQLQIAVVISWIVACLFAYITNRKWVFHTQAKGFKENFKEFCKFIAGRAFTMFIEFFGCMILFKTPIPAIISKLTVNVIVIILNFFISKFFAFKKK